MPYGVPMKNIDPVKRHAQILIISLIIACLPALGQSPPPATGTHITETNIGGVRLEEHFDTLEELLDRRVWEVEFLVELDLPLPHLQAEAERLRHRLESLEACLQAQGTVDPAQRERSRMLNRSLVEFERFAVDPTIRQRGHAPTWTSEKVSATKIQQGGETCEAALELGPGTYQGDTTGAESDGASSCSNSSLSPDLWFKYTAEVSGQHVATLEGADFDTVLSGGTDCLETVDRWSCSDNGSGDARIDFEASAGTTWYFRVAGFASSSGSFTLRIGPVGAISGKVFDEATGTPLVGATVWAHGEDGIRGAALSGGDGSYRIEGLAADTYVLTAEAEDHLSELYDGEPCPHLLCDPTAGSPVTVMPGEEATGHEFHLAEGGTISGTVTSRRTGEGLGFVTIRILDEEGQRVPTGLFHFTGADGRYSVGGLEAGRYFVAAVSSTHEDLLYPSLPCPSGAPDECDFSQGTAVEVQRGENRSGVDFSLRELGTIEGQILTAEGMPVEFADVNVYDPEGELVKIGPVHGNGRYVVSGLEPGTYFLASSVFDDLYLNEVFGGGYCVGFPVNHCEPAAGTPVTVALDAPLRGIDFRLDRSGSVFGEIRDEETGERIADSTMLFFDSDGELSALGFAPSGAYEMYQFVPGDYFAVAVERAFISEVYDDTPCPTPCDPTAGQALAVGVGTRTGSIDFDLERLGSLTGHVAPEGSFGRVLVFDSQGEMVSEGAVNFAGDYRVVGLDTGIYFAMAESSEFASEIYLGEQCDNVCDPTRGTPVEVVRGENTSGIDFTLAELGSIAGEVVVAPGNPAVEGWVEILGGELPFPRFGYVERDGRFSIPAVPSGTYTLRARAFGYIPELLGGAHCPFDICDPSVGTMFEVREQEEAGPFVFQLDRAGLLSGKVVREPDGAPLEGEAVELWSSSGEFLERGEADQEGRYVFSGLLSGAYRVVAGGLRSRQEVFPEVPCTEGPQAGCDLSEGALVHVELGLETEHIDFVLDPVFCSPSEEFLCLGGRFYAYLQWEDAEGNSGQARTVSRTDDEGYFWISNPDEVEVEVKIHDACDLEGSHSYWVFAAGVSQLGLSLVVEDGVTYDRRTYENELGTPFEVMKDRDAFRTCSEFDAGAH